MLLLFLVVWTHLLDERTASLTTVYNLFVLIHAKTHAHTYIHTNGAFPVWTLSQTKCYLS